MGKTQDIPKCREFSINHHEQALLAYWKDREKTSLLITNRSELELSESNQLICGLAEKLTLNRVLIFQTISRLCRSRGWMTVLSWMQFS